MFDYKVMIEYHYHILYVINLSYVTSSCELNESSLVPDEFSECPAHGLNETSDECNDTDGWIYTDNQCIQMWSNIIIFASLYIVYRQRLESTACGTPYSKS